MSIGRPSASTRTWILVVSPPRERPPQLFQRCLHRRNLELLRPCNRPDPLFSIRGVLMNANAGTVDHLNVAVESAADGAHEIVPDAGFAPAHESVVAGRMGAVGLAR